jgi:hypothetical protein
MIRWSAIADWHRRPSLMSNVLFQLLQQLIVQVLDLVAKLAEL